MALPDYDLGPLETGDLKIPELSPEFEETLRQLLLPPLVRKQPPPCGLIEIAGSTLAAGKTAATLALEEILVGPPIIVHQERWWNNPYLQRPDSFRSECWFLTAKAEDNRRIGRYPPEAVVVQDVSPELDAFYAATDFALGRLEEKELWLYQELYSQLAAAMVQPDLVVYLDCGLPEIFRRIRQRGRGFEQTQGLRIVALEYLTKRWLQKGGWDVPVLTINSERLDFDNNHQGKRELARRVVEKLRELDGEKFGGLGVRR